MATTMTMTMTMTMTIRMTIRMTMLPLIIVKVVSLMWLQVVGKGGLKLKGSDFQNQHRYYQNQ